MKRHLSPLALLLIFFLSHASFADEEASNSAHVKSSLWGKYYVKSIPSENYGMAGKTQLYLVTQGKDEFLEEYNFFSSNIFLHRSHIVALGPWNRGRETNDQDLAVAFYNSAKEIEKYTTQDIFKISNKLSHSVSHYSVFKSINGLFSLYRRDGNNILVHNPDIAFSVTLWNDEELLFNVETGKIISKEADLIIESTQ